MNVSDLNNKCDAVGLLFIGEPHARLQVSLIQLIDHLQWKSLAALSSAMAEIIAFATSVVPANFDPDCDRARRHLRYQTLRLEPLAQFYCWHPIQLNLFE